MITKIGEIMIKKIIWISFVMFFVFSKLISVKLQQTVIIPEYGFKTIVKDGNFSNLQQTEIISRNERVEILWQYTDPAAIAGEMNVSPNDETFVGWYLNDERASYYLNSATPMWEDPDWDPDFGFDTDMLNDGSIMVAAANQVARVYSSESNIIWEKYLNPTQSFADVAISPDGLYIYAAVYDQSSGNSFVAAFLIGNDDPFWQIDFLGSANCLILSGDGSRLVFTQYSGENSAMRVMDSSNGAIIFEGPEQNQNPPAISYDGTFIVNGDYSGDLFVYEYIPAEETYQLNWSYQVSNGGGGYNPWISAMSISSDGSTIAAGSLIFHGDYYGGEIYLFNTQSSFPIWIFDANGPVEDLDISSDGSTIAGAGYGPIDHSTPDFWIFGRNSNEPEFTINSSGSMFHLDLSEDGNLCSVGGKAVHAYDLGNGGLLYNLECDLGGGTISGTVDLVGNDDDSGVLIEIPELENYYAITDIDGNYSLVFVPSGMYTVKASKDWYQTVTEEFVLVFDDEITQMDIMMNELIIPPENVVASIVGAGTTALIDWDEPDNSGESRDLESYNIWRLLEGEEDTPDNWIFVTNIGQTFCLDSDWHNLPNGIYKYAVNAVFLSNESDMAFSNTLEISSNEPINYGDVDDNDFVQAFDASLCLMYAVGLDPLPDVDPLPWDDWRFITADVDGNESIQAYDASLILQYAVGLIDHFPVEDGRFNTSTPFAGVRVKVEDNYLAFYADGDLFSFELQSENNIFANPELTNEDILVSSNINDYKYSIALCSAYSVETNTMFLKVPLEIPDETFSEIVLNMVVNTENIEMIIDPNMYGANDEIAFNQVLGNHPNPFNPLTYIKFAVKENNTPVNLQIFNIKGQLINTLISNKLDGGYHNIVWNGFDSSGNRVSSGIYLFRTEIGNNTFINKMILMK